MLLLRFRELPRRNTVPSSSPRRNRHLRLGFEQLEDRCVPSTLVANQHHVGPIGLLWDAAQLNSLPPGVPNTVAKTIGLAQKNVHALNSVLSMLAVKQTQSPPGSIGAAVLG